MSEQAKRQEYSCEECGVESHVTYFERDGAFAVVNAIEDDHRKWSPECQTPVRGLRVRGVSPDSRRDIIGK